MKWCAVLQHTVTIIGLHRIRAGASDIGALGKTYFLPPLLEACHAKRGEIIQIQSFGAIFSHSITFVFFQILDPPLQLVYLYII